MISSKYVKRVVYTCSLLCAVFFSGSQMEPDKQVDNSNQTELKSVYILEDRPQNKEVITESNNNNRTEYLLSNEYEISLSSENGSTGGFIYLNDGNEQSAKLQNATLLSRDSDSYGVNVFNEKNLLFENRILLKAEAVVGDDDAKYKELISLIVEHPGQVELKLSHWSASICEEDERFAAVRLEGVYTDKVSGISYMLLNNSELTFYIGGNEGLAD